MIRKNRGLYRELFNESIIDIKQNLYKYIFFEMFYKGINAVVILPILIILFDKFLISLGINSAFNDNHILFGIGIEGILQLVFIVFIALVSVFMELSTLTILSYKNVLRKNISLISAFILSIKKIPLLFGKGILKLFLYFLLVVPFVGMTIDTPVLKFVSIPKFIEEEIFNSNAFTVVYVILIIAMTFLYIRWVFVINYMVCDNCKITEALNKSKRISKGFYFSMFTVLIIANIILPILTIGIIFVISIIVAYIGNIFGLNFLFLGFEEYFSIFGNQIFIVLSMLTSPLSVILITKIFVYRKRIFNESMVDTMKNSFPSRVSLKRRNMVTIIAIVFFACFTTLAALKNLDYKIKNSNIQIVAHRGVTDKYPENTIGAIRKSIEKDADYIEIDIQRTKDGVLVLFHDKNLFRLTGVNKEISDITYNELKNIKVRDNYILSSSNESIPTLEEVLRYTKDKIKLMIELKCYGEENEFANDVIELLNRYHVKNQVIIQSSQYSLLKDVREIDASITIGYIAYILGGGIYSLDVDFYSIEQSILSDKSINKIKSLGKGIWVWTVNDDIDIFDNLRKDIDGIITDKVDKVKSEMERMKRRYNL